MFFMLIVVQIMKTNPISPFPHKGLLDMMHGLTHGVIAAVFILSGLNGDTARGQESARGNDTQGAEVLTRGPVHEAFAGIVSFNPEPGDIVEKAPPAAIEELPPEERPEGDHITWIPGYWAWDDERNDFLWISGTWRALPPGRQWIAGYWAKADNGYQWISGYWADATVQETTYLPKPPVTVETGPNVKAPSRDYGWTPGSWVWHTERYAWRPGYWVEGRSDWDWIPAHYVWTPRGYVFVDGYWDYGISRRGVLFAPVYIQSGSYSRPGYSYSPFVAINLLAFMENIFLRPRYHHYYFGDYYDSRYEKRGYYSPFVFQSNRYGYDSVYSHQRWQHRKDRDWERNFETSYQYRRDHESARPPRTWVAQMGLSPDAQQPASRMARSFDQMARAKDGPVRFQKVPGKERQKLAQLGHDIQRSRDGRRMLETRVSEATEGKSGQEIKPTRVKLPKSPIVGKPASSLDRKLAPPKPQRTPVLTPKVEPKSPETDHESDADKTRPKGKPENDKSQQKPSRGRNDVTPPEKVKQPEPEPKVTEPKEKPESKIKEPKEKSEPKVKDLKEKHERRQEPREPDVRKEPAKEQEQATTGRTQIPSRGKAGPPAKPREEPQRPSAKSERKVKSQPQRPEKDEEPAKTRRSSPLKTKFTEKPQKETEKPRGKGGSSTEEDDEKSAEKNSRKGPR